MALSRRHAIRISKHATDAHDKSSIKLSLAHNYHMNNDYIIIKECDDKPSSHLKDHPRDCIRPSTASKVSHTTSKFVKDKVNKNSFIK